MALANKKSGTIHNKTERESAKLKTTYDEGGIDFIADVPEDSPNLAAVIYQLKLMQDDIDELRRFCGVEEKGRIDDAINSVDKVSKALEELTKKK